MFRRRKTWLITLAILILGAAGAAYAITTGEEASEEGEAPLQTSIARQGDITLSATAAGSIIAANEVVLTFPGNGTLTELLVQVGDHVQAGDVLARIDDSAAQQALVNAQLQLAQAAKRSDAGSTEIGISTDDINIAMARMNLDQAQSTLDDLLHWEVDEDEVTIMEANLATAEASYENALGQEASSGSGIIINQINVDQALRSLDSAQEAWDTAYDPAREWMLNDSRQATKLENERVAADSNLLRAQESLTIAQANYSSAVSNSASTGSLNAQSNLLNAQQALEKALAGPDEDQIESAQRSVRQAELNLQQVLLNHETNLLSLAQSRLSVSLAETSLEETTLLAPINGTVMAINASVGENVGANFMTLADLEQPLLEVFLDETDMNMVGVGFEVEVVFDALPNDLFSGEIVQVDPQLVSQGGVTAVRALVQLNSFAKPQTLPVGMNATVDVIGGQAQNAVLVPVEALRELSQGQYAVFVIEEDEPVLRIVEVGLMDFSFAEILSGVQAGETVSTGIIETN